MERPDPEQDPSTADRPAWARHPAPPVLDGPPVPGGPLGSDRPVIRLRPLREDDEAAVARSVLDPDLIRWTTTPHPYPEDGFAEWLADARRGWQDATGVTWAIADPADDDYLGAIDLRLDGEAGAEVGYAVAPWARGRGVATAALVTACRWGFDVAGVDVVLWLAFAGNEVSRRTARRAGFRVLDGVVRRGLAQRGERRDAWIGDLLPQDLPPAGRAFP